MPAPKNINLLERHRTNVRRRRAKVGRIQTLALVFLGAYIALVAVVMVIQFSLNASLSGIEDDIASEEARIEELAVVESIQAILKNKLALFEGIFENPKQYVQVVEDFVAIAPEGVGIGSMVFEDAPDLMSVGLTFEDYFAYEEFSLVLESEIAPENRFSTANIAGVSRNEIGEYSMNVLLEVNLEESDELNS